MFSFIYLQITSYKEKFVKNLKHVFSNGLKCHFYEFTLLEYVNSYNSRDIEFLPVYQNLKFRFVDCALRNLLLRKYLSNELKVLFTF